VIFEILNPLILIAAPPKLAKLLWNLLFIREKFVSVMLTLFRSVISVCTRKNRPTN
jgi:hypothetical protein